MSQRESNTVYPRNPVDEMDLTLISGPTVTAPTSALTEGPGPAPGGGEALSESNRSENYRLLRISLREGSVVVRGLHVGIVAHRRGTAGCGCMHLDDGYNGLQGCWSKGE